MALPKSRPAPARFSREGMLEGFSLGNYLLLVDHSARLFREVKATLSQSVRDSRPPGNQRGLSGRRGWRSSARVVCWAATCDHSAASQGGRRASGREACTEPGRVPGIVMP